MLSSNKFFLYEGNILRSANSKLYEVLKYWEPGRKVFYGNPQHHTLEITKVAKKLVPKYLEFEKECEDLENSLITK